jgi:signal transduction histidine kinase
MTGTDSAGEKLWAEQAAQFRHELQLPLQVIQACTQVLRDHWRDLDEEGRTVMLGQIRYAAKRHGELLDQLEEHVLWRAYQRSQSRRKRPS